MRLNMQKLNPNKSVSYVYIVYIQVYSFGPLTQRNQAETPTQANKYECQETICTHSSSYEAKLLDQFKLGNTTELI